MKKVLLLSVIVISFMTANAQNIQLHYDFTKDREYFTTTIEMFKPDKWGTSFFFVDMDYNTFKGSGGVNLSYTEIARTFFIPGTPFSAHVEYNGGIFQLNNAITININNSWLAGIDYSWNAPDYSKGVSLKALYKYIQRKHDFSYQATAVWYWHFLDRKMTFTGFLDFWREDRDLNLDGKVAKFVLLTEPQIWYNFTENFSLGGEVELSNNFVAEEFKVFPTVAVKWTF